MRDKNYSYMTQKSNEQIGYVDFSNTVVDYQDGDVVMFDHVEVLSKAYPLKPKTTLIGFCKVHFFVDFGRNELFKADLLEIENNVGDVFDNAVDRCKFMTNAIDMDRSDTETWFKGAELKNAFRF